ncbi:hypothetical protein BDV96DRAFT_235772 [Lophiotrema nucula]|uniref:Uncharacterized protein n=1 Tax=Lophiotrema nucula TaxID=690887 RepID=A0A6A5YQL1_9PLEO|nr:hypothetical protein BDV96DRAFT_235772 [Lophiotrema nucula]
MLISSQDFPIPYPQNPSSFESRDLVALPPFAGLASCRFWAKHDPEPFAKRSRVYDGRRCRTFFSKLLKSATQQRRFKEGRSQASAVQTGRLEQWADNYGRWAFGGAVGGLALSIASRSSFPGARGWRRHVGVASVGSAVGLALSIYYYERFQPVRLAIANNSSPRNCTTKQNARLNWSSTMRSLGHHYHLLLHITSSFRRSRSSRMHRFCNQDRVHPRMGLRLHPVETISFTRVQRDMDAINRLNLIEST